jgi:hypothetical protein
MQTRRQLVQSALLLPLVPATLPAVINAAALRYEIFSGRDCLSQESAEGYRSFLADQRWPLARHRHVLIVSDPNIGLSQFLELCSLAVQGALLIWETTLQNNLLGDAFGLHCSQPTRGDALYLSYRWPVNTMIRIFRGALSLGCNDDEAIAHYNGQPVALRRRLGRGGIIVLGSMLGPHLKSGDRESAELAAGFLEVLG